MKTADKILRYMRTCQALKFFPESSQSVLDIGCGEDGYLLKKVKAPVRHGVDPILKNHKTDSGFFLFKGRVPEVLGVLPLEKSYDVIFALAVLEHLSSIEMENLKFHIESLLGNTGLFIVTVPHPFVDKILFVLSKLKVIDGIELHQHHGLDPSEIERIFSESLDIVNKKKFQFGLNNLYVFKKR